MIIRIDFQSDIPIYTQLINQIVEGIANGSLKHGEMLPSVRQMAQDIGINMHTVNKAYNLLKQDGYILIHRQKGVVVNPDGFEINKEEYLNKLNNSLRPLITESIVRGLSINEFKEYCEQVYNDILKKEDE